MNLQSTSSNDPLYGANFFVTDESSSVASGHIIAVISKNVSDIQAVNILSKLTHAPTNMTIANSMVVSTELLYLMHLPRDIVAYVPSTGLNNPRRGSGRKIAGSDREHHHRQ